MKEEVSVKKAGMHKGHSLTLEEKKAFCEAWQASGLSRPVFCREHGLADSTLYRWYRQLYPKQKRGSRHQFMPVLPVKKAKENNIMEQIQTMVEVTLPNKTIVRMTLPTLGIVPLIQELCHAATTIR